MATDLFNRADGALGSGWINGFNSNVVVDNGADASVGADWNVSYRDTAVDGAYSNDQEAEVVLIDTQSGTFHCGPSLRCSGIAGTFAGIITFIENATLNCILAAAGTFGGAEDQSFDLTGNEFVDGDILKVRVVGHVVSAYKNGSLLHTFSAFVSDPSSGTPGFNIFNTGPINSFTGNSFSAATLTQTHHRFRNDDGSESTATGAAAQDAGFSGDVNTNYRLRIQADTSGDLGSSAFQIEAKLNSGSFFAVTAPPSQQVVTVTTTGDGSFVVPANVNSIQVELWGGGGAGSRRSTNGAGGGGAGGAYVKQTLSVTPGDTIGYHVGAGATQAASPANGEDSTWNTTTLVAKGGTSVAANTATGATAPASSASTGTTKFAGGNGANGTTSSFGGGGGSSAGNAATGNNGSGVTGGSAPTGGGAGGNGRNSTQGAGNAGSVPGGGGGGALRTASGTQNGGSGANGKLIITYTATPPVVLAGSSNIAAAAATSTTAQLSVPGGHSFTAGRISDDTNPFPAIDPANNNYLEFEFCFQAVGGVALDADTITFRLTIGGVAFGTYTAVPVFTVGGITSVSGDDGGTVVDTVTAIKRWRHTINESAALTEKITTATRLILSGNPAGFSGSVFTSPASFYLWDNNTPPHPSENGISVTLSIVSGPGSFTLGSVVTVLSGVGGDGLVIFNNVGVNTPGNYVFRATVDDTSLGISSADTATVTIAAASQLVNEATVVVDSNSVKFRYKDSEPESVVVVDTAAATVTPAGGHISVGVADGGAVVDSAVGPLTIKTTINESLVAIDTFLGAIRYVLPDEIAALVDSANYRLTVDITINESTNLADSITFTLKPALGGEQVVVQHDLVYLLTIPILINEHVSLSDSSSSALPQTDASDSTAVTDSVTARIRIATAVNELLNLQDSVFYDLQGTITQNVGETTLVTDNLIINITYGFTLSEVALIRDTVITDAPQTPGHGGNDHRRKHWWRRRRHG